MSEKENKNSLETELLGKLVNETREFRKEVSQINFNIIGLVNKILIAFVIVVLIICASNCVQSYIYFYSPSDFSVTAKAENSNSNENVNKNINENCNRRCGD